MDLSKLDWKFTIFDTPVRVMATFWLLCVFFSPFSTGHDGPWIFGLLGWTAAVLATFLTHELGHAYAMRKAYGGRPRIDLGVGRTANGALVFGGLTSLSSNGANTPENRAFTASAGPLAEIGVSLLFVVLMSGLGVKFKLAWIMGFLPLPFPAADSFAWLQLTPLIFLAHYFTIGFIYAGIAWGILNLLPIYPFDGGQVLLAYLCKRQGEQGVVSTLKISIVCSVGLALLCLVDRQYFMTIFMAYSAFQNYKLLQSRYPRS